MELIVVEIPVSIMIVIADNKMRMQHLFVLISLLFVLASCQEREGVAHVGVIKNDSTLQLVFSDSILINADSMSCNGNFYIQDSVLTFADMTLCTLFRFDLNSGKSIGNFFAKGNGHNEIPSLMYAYPVEGSKGKCYIIGNSLEIATFDNNKNEIERIGKIDFAWDKYNVGYDATTLYNLMFMTDFGVDFSSVNDSTWMVPVSIIDRKLKDVTTERYSKGHIFAEVNSKTFKVNKVFGSFPEIYKEKPTTLFEFFQYTKHSDTIFVNHAIDSLIYVYKYPDELLYTIGYDVSGAKRNYKRHLSQDKASFAKEAANVSLNTGLKYDNGLLFRTVIKDMATGKSAIQVYAENNLVSEVQTPPMFKYLGYYRGIYYGTTFIPKELDGKLYYVLYKMKLKNNERDS